MPSWESVWGGLDNNNNKYPLSLTNFVVHTALHLPYSRPALLLLYLRVIVQDLVPQPGQVVDTYLVLFALIESRGRLFTHKTNFISYLNLFQLHLEIPFQPNQDSRIMILTIAENSAQKQKLLSRNFDFEVQSQKAIKKHFKGNSKIWHPVFALQVKWVLWCNINHFSGSSAVRAGKWLAAIMTWYSDEQVEALQDVHLLEPAGVDEGVDLALTTTVQQLQTILCAHQQVHTWWHTHA